MKSYPPFIAGQAEPCTKWIHVLRASALLDDAFGALTLKRQLDRGAEAEPGDDRLAGRVGLASPEQSAAALAAARKAQPEWARVPLKERLAFGAAVNARFREYADAFVEMLIAEGHPRRLAQWEVAGVIQGSSPESLAATAEMMLRVEQLDQRETRLVRKPDGVVCVSPPQNAAASNSLLGLPALIAGNALVVKAPRSGPLGTAWAWQELVAPVLEEFGAPSGVLSVVCGAPRALLDQWLASPDVDDIMFFGSSERGLELERECVARGKKPVLELAGNDGVLVWRDAEIELAAQAVAECFYGSAQICMVPKYAIVHPAVADEFLAALGEVVAQIRPGRPEEEHALLAPVVKTEGFFTVLEAALQGGAELVRGGQRLDFDGTPSSSGVFLEPTLLRVDGLEKAAGLDAVREESFFPMLPVVVPEQAGDAELLEQALRFMDSNAYGLRNSLWARDPEVVDAFCDGMRNGGLLKVNDSHLGFVGGLPTHGGTGRTGGAFGECNFPMLRTSHLQGISIAGGVTPRSRVFDSALPPAARRSTEESHVPAE
ncbi:aldehyde dehydrogenase family protein [Streptomyces sp. NPDC089799]|uniref:aldehyde dehydrogenase family protein n=1 Tax=Streptomyces sp. NPDC089799 TaxID=3155066 RepID=UPI0034221664